MALQPPRIIYGVHSITPANKFTGMPYGILKVIGSASLALASDLEQLYAGSNKYAWAAENKTVSTELTAKVKAYPGFLFALFLGATVVDVAADANGTVSTPIALQGAVINPTTGLATITVSAANKANLKFGKYVARVTAAKTLKLYLLSDIDISRGIDGAYVDDSLEVGTVVLTDTGTVTTLVDHGLEFTSGSGTVALTTGDTISFSVLPPSVSSSEIIVGKSTDTFPAFSALLLSQKRATGEMFEIEAHNCVGGGLPISMEELAFSQPKLKMTCLYEATRDRVFTIRHIQPAI